MGVLDELAGRVQRAIENDRKKAGGMTFGASARLGLAEIRLVAAMPGSVAEQTQTPLGMYGTLTPGEVSAARQEGGAADGVELEAVEAGASADPVSRGRESAGASGPKGETGGKGVGK